MTTVAPMQESRRAMAPFDQQAAISGQQALEALLNDWRRLKPGQSLASAKTSEQVRASLSTLNQLSQPGKLSDVARIIDRLLSLYPSRGEAPESVQEDWVRVLAEEPIASIWAAYEKFIRRPGQWAPSLGDFLSEVQRHAGTVNRVRLSLTVGK